MSGSGDAERAARVARALTLHNRRWSSRAIGAELGVSHTTAQEWIVEAQHAELWREVTERAGRRNRMSGWLNELGRIGTERLLAVHPNTLPDGTPHPQAGQPVERYKDVVPALMTVVQEINRVEGNYAPVQVAIDDRRPPDPALIAALEAEARRAELGDADEQRRALEE